MRILQLLPRFREAYRAVECLTQREQWSREQIDDWQLRQLNQLWHHAIQHVDYYRHLRVQHQLPIRFASLSDFRQSVPLLPKSLVRQSPQRFISEAAQAGSWERTSGSTGMPMQVYHDTAGHRDMQHAKYRLYEAWGIDVLDRSAYLWSRADFVTPGLRGWLNRARLGALDALRSRARFSAFSLDRETLGDCLAKLERFRPRALYGFSNAIFMLALEAAQCGFRQDWLKVVIMTSEPATPRMQNTVAEALGAPAVIEYGATECELIAGLYPDGTLRIREDLVLLETLSQPSGNYELVITVLTNSSFPLIRYQIEDLTDAALVQPPQGMAILPGRILGRRDDLIQTRSGGYLHPTGIDALFEQVLDSSAVRRYQAHQDRYGALTMQIEIDPSRPFNIDVEELGSALSEMIGGFPVEIDVTSQMQRSNASKHRTITSDLTAARRTQD